MPKFNCHCYSSPEDKIYIFLDLDRKHSEVSKTVWIMSEYNRTYLAGKTQRTNHSDFVFVLRSIFSMGFHRESRFLRDLLAVPIASTGCQQSLEIGWGYSLCNEEVRPSWTRVTWSVLLDRGAWPESMLQFVFLLYWTQIIQSSILSIIYVKKIPKVVLQK